MNEPDVFAAARKRERERVDALASEWQRRCHGRLRDCARLLWRMQTSDDVNLRRYADARWYMLGRRLLRCVRGAEARDQKEVRRGEAAVRVLFGSVVTRWGIASDQRSGPSLLPVSLSEGTGQAE